MNSKNTLKTIFLTFLLMYTFNSFSQERTCGMLEYMEEQMKDPAYAKQHEENQAKFKARLKQVLAEGDFSQRGGGPIQIPVAVHFPSGNESDRACLEALAQNQIDILNADFTASNSDISQWTSASPFYPGLTTGAANITFCLATSNHPAALSSQLVEGQPAVTIGYNFANGSGFPELDSNFQGYMNFLVKDIGNGLLGYSPLGGSVANGAAVVLNLNTFGSGPGCPGSGIVPAAPFNLGRTTTHELGHFYNLNHPWGPAAPSCSADDGIADTPNTGQETYGCPAPGSLAACTPGQNILSMNFMDYVNDACMYMFTPGQANVVDAYVGGVLQSQFKPGVCEPATPGFNLVADNSPIFSCPSNDTEAVFNLTYTTIAGFSETTTFSATGAPAGSVVTFSPTSLDDSGNFTMTVGNLGSTAQGEYTIIVTGTSNSVTETVNVLLKNTCTEIQCTTYSSAESLGLAIPDGTGTSTPVNGPPVTNIINIADTGSIESLKVSVDISHTYVGDLLVRVTHPDGTTLSNLWAGDCGSNDDFDVTFEDGAPAIDCGNPTTGTFAPLDALSVFNGLEASGDWEILMADFFAGDTGTLNDWSIEICREVPLSVTEVNGLNNFTIYPNPNSGTFNVKFSNTNANDTNIEVYDVRGRRIFSKDYEASADFDQSINLDAVQSGLYMVRVKNGDHTVTRKIIVE